MRSQCFPGVWVMFGAEKRGSAETQPARLGATLNAIDHARETPQCPCQFSRHIGSVPWGLQGRLLTHPCIEGRRVGCATQILYGSDITPLSLAAHMDASGNDLDNSSPSSHNQNVTKHSMDQRATVEPSWLIWGLYETASDVCGMIV